MVACHGGPHGSSVIMPCAVGSTFFPMGILRIHIFFFVGNSWVTTFFLWVFRRYQSFSSGYSVGTQFFAVGISWLQNFLLWAIWQFSGVCRMRKSSTVIYLKLRILFELVSTSANFIYIRNLLHLLNSLCYYAVLICTNWIFSHLFFLGNRIYLRWVC